MTLRNDLIILLIGTIAAVAAPILVITVDAYWKGLIP